MLLRFLRSKYSFIYVVLFLFAIFIYSGFSQHIIDYREANTHLLGKYFLRLIDFSSSNFDFISIGFFFFFLQAIVASAVVARFTVLHEINALPSFIYLLLLIQEPDLLVRPDVSIAFLLIILSYFYFFSFAASEKILFPIFQLGLLLGTAFLFSMDSFFIILLAPVLVLIIHRSLRLRDFFAYIVGLIVPIYFYFVTYFLINDEVYSVLNDFTLYFGHLWNIRFHLDNHLILLLIVFILFLLGSYKYFMLKRVKISVRFSYYQLSVVFYLSMLSYFIVPWFNEIAWAYMVFPLSVLFSMLFMEIRRFWIAEGLFLLFFVFEILQQFDLLNRYLPI